MGIRSSWHDEARSIIYQQYTGRWTWEDFYTSWQQTTRMADGIAHRIDFIVDLRESRLMPELTLKRAQNVIQLPAARVGINVVVGGNALIKAFLRTTEHFFGSTGRAFRLAHADTIEEAHRLILESRASDESPADRAETV